MKTSFKKILVLFLTVACLCCVAPMALAAGRTYSDVPAGHWAHDVISKWSGGTYEVLEGNEDGTFAPNRELKLGELAAIFTRYFGYTERTAAVVTPAWADEYVEKAIAAGVIEAKAEINADAVVTREEAVMYAAKAFGIEPITGNTSFADDADIDEAYKGYVNAFQRLGFVVGKGNDIFDPKAAYTRAEAMKVMDNATCPGIVGVSTIGFVDVDGAKVSALAVEYNVDMSGAKVAAGDYAIEINKAAVWDDATCINSGSGKVGDVTAIYVNDKPEVSANGGTGTGKYVIIEVYTDYLWGSEQAYTSSMTAGVAQTATLKAGSVTIAPSKKQVTNFAETQTFNSFKQQWQTKLVVDDGSFTISGLEGFKYYTNSTAYPADGPAFHPENCFNEQTGEYSDVDLSYALYVPEDYNPKGSYALVTLENPAANEGTHPYASVLETRGPSVYASEWAQNLVKEKHGLDGLIVVVPTVTQRVNDNGCTPAQYEALVKLWDKLLADYSIDENYIYGNGQSVGGMVLMETNRNRDNFFAGIWMFENQWCQNYYKDTLFVRNMASDAKTAATAGMHYPRTDDYITWDYYLDTDGNKVYADHDPQNYYYLISDDNVLVTSRSANALSVNTWTELNYLYTDLVGYTIPKCTLNAQDSLASQAKTISDYLAAGSTFNGTKMGFNWVTFENGVNGYSCRRTNAGYEWLLSQSRETEIARPKLDLNKPFALADVQDTSAERVVAGFADPADGTSTTYYLTGKAGAGTQFYNTSWLNLSKVADAVPGWLPEGMSWTTGVKAAKIVDVTAINGADGKLSAVAVKYDSDMANAVINLKGDDIIGLDGSVRSDIKIAIEPYDIYDANGKKIECDFTNAYVSGTAAVRAGASRGSGSGNYIIIELDTSSTASSVGVVQRTTVRTNNSIASASAKLWK